MPTWPDVGLVMDREVLPVEFDPVFRAVIPETFDVAFRAGCRRITKHAHILRQRVDVLEPRMIALIGRISKSASRTG